MKDLPIGKVAVNELSYNLLCRAIEYDVLPFCHENGIGVIGYFALLQGILAGKFPALNDVPDRRKRTRHFNSESSRESRHGEPGAESETNTSLEAIRKLSEKSGLTMSELAVKWILANPAITCSLVGSRNIQQLENNVKAIEGTLDKSLTALLFQ